MTYFMSNLMQWMVSGGASELHPRVGMSHFEGMMKFDRNLLMEAQCVLPRGMRRTLSWVSKLNGLATPPGLEELKK